MYYVMDAHSFYNFIYFILLIIVSIRASSGPWTMALGGDREKGRGGEGWPVPRKPSRLGEPGRTGGSWRSRQSIPKGGIFLNAANQLVIERARQGCGWEHPSCPLAFTSHL